MCMQLPRFVLPSILLVVSFSLEVRSAEPAPDSIAIVRRFADAMLDKSRANLPHKDLPLFPLALFVVWGVLIAALAWVAERDTDTTKP